MVTDLEILESGDVSFTLTVFNDSPRSVTGLSCEVGVVNSNTVELGSTVVDGFGDIGAGESLVAASAVQLPLGAADTTVRGVARCDGQAR